MTPYNPHHHEVLALLERIMDQLESIDESVCAIRDTLDDREVGYRPWYDHDDADLHDD